MIENYAERLARFILAPFKITKLIEAMFAFNWQWHFFLLLLPSYLVSGSVYSQLSAMGLDRLQMQIVIGLFACLSIVSIVRNIIRLRKIILIINIAFLIVIATSAMTSGRTISAGAGFIIILIVLAVVAFWRMDYTH